jgi:hypothetical protein
VQLEEALYSIDVRGRGVSDIPNYHVSHLSYFNTHHLLACSLVAKKFFLFYSLTLLTSRSDLNSSLVRRLYSISNIFITLPRLMIWLTLWKQSLSATVFTYCTEIAKISYTNFSKL